MAFQYLELTRRQLGRKVTANPSPGNARQRMGQQNDDKNAAGDINEALNDLGADDWELVSVVEAHSYNSEILYVFKKTI